MTPGIHNGKPTVAYQLFNHQFACRIQNMHLIKGVEKAHRTGYHSNDPDIEALTRSEYTEVYRTPVGMILLYDQGIIPYIVNKKDVLTIYNLITKHLNNWAREIQNPVSVLQPPPPLDLIQMETFSQYIYDDAMFEQASMGAKDRIANHDNSLQNFLDLFGGRSGLQQLRTTTVTDPAALRSIAEAWDVVVR